MRRLFPLLLALTAACNRTPNPEQPWSITEKTEQQSGKGYALKLTYPVIQSGPISDALKIQLNKQLAEEALTMFEQVEDDPIPFTEYAKNYAEDRAKEDADQSWANETAMTIVHRATTHITTLAKSYSFAGGAHPNQRAQYENWTLTDGRRLELDDILEPGKVEPLRALVEKRFREIRGIKPGAKLDEEGYLFEPGHLTIDADFGLLADRIVFHYDPYEVAAYALGETDVPIPYTDLKGILKPAYIAH